MTEAIIWIAFAAAQMADIWTTNRALKAGLYEANPIWRWVQDRLGRAWVAPRFAGAFVIAVGLDHVFGALPVAIMALGIAAVAANNWRLTREAQKGR